MRSKLVFIFSILFILSVFGACDMTTSDKVEGVWVSVASDSSIKYEESYTIQKGGAYVLDRKEDGKSVYSEKGTWTTSLKTMGDLDGEHRVITFVSSDTKVKPYDRFYSIENGGRLLVLGSLNLENDQVDKQRYFKKEEAK